MNEVHNAQGKRRAWIRRAALLTGVATLVLLWWWLAPDEAAGLALVKSQLADLQRWNQASPWQFRAAFFTFYVLVAAFSVPGIAVLTVAAGAVLCFL